MSPIGLFFWVILPYLSLTTFVVGHILRWQHDQFGWTCHSTQLQEQRLLKWGSPLFHYGTLTAIAGHVIGILVPGSWTAAAGIREETYHIFSAYAGAGAGALVVLGMLILLVRRLAVDRVRMTTFDMDLPMYALLVIVVGLGLAETIVVNLIGPGYDYRPTVGIWFRGIFAGNPQPALMMSAPLIYQVHAITAWFLFAIWPFSRLVHAWSLPIWYLWRPYILYRRRFQLPRAAAGPGARSPRRTSTSATRFPLSAERPD